MMRRSEKVHHKDVFVLIVTEHAMSIIISPLRPFFNVLSKFLKLFADGFVCYPTIATRECSKFTAQHAHSGSRDQHASGILGKPGQFPYDDAKLKFQVSRPCNESSYTVEDLRRKSVNIERVWTVMGAYKLLDLGDFTFQVFLIKSPASAADESDNCGTRTKKTIGWIKRLPRQSDDTSGASHGLA